MLEHSPLSLYVHIPWCVRKCPYCDFNSHEAKSDIPEAEYVHALVNDLKAESVERSNCDGRKFQSIFFGGGTPSLFSAKSISQILETAEYEFGFENDIEITLEANPGTAESQKFREFNAIGINRLSLGIQSFHNHHLQSLGRIHDSDEARKAIDLCAQAGFNNFNLDLMHGLPNQSIEEALADLGIALEYEPTHISWYQLTIEPNTAFHSKPPTLPEDSILWDINQSGLNILHESGYQQYEVSAYARPGKESVHNLNYWRFGDYVGIGAGAHGKFTIPEKNSIVRSRKKKQPDHYINAELNRVVERLPVAMEERAFEFLMNALRLRNGFSQSQFEKRTGVTFSSIAKQVEYLSAQKLLSVKDQQITTTDHGYRVLNSLLEEFLDND